MEEDGIEILPEQTCTLPFTVEAEEHDTWAQKLYRGSRVGDELWRPRRNRFPRPPAIKAKYFHRKFIRRLAEHGDEQYRYQHHFYALTQVERGEPCWQGAWTQGELE